MWVGTCFAQLQQNRQTRTENKTCFRRSAEETEQQDEVVEYEAPIPPQTPPPLLPPPYATEAEMEEQGKGGEDRGKEELEAQALTAAAAAAAHREFQCRLTTGGSAEIIYINVLTSNLGFSSCFADETMEGGGDEWVIRRREE